MGIKARYQRDIALSCLLDPMRNQLVSSNDLMHGCRVFCDPARH